MNNKVVIIVSAIYLKDKRLSYSSARSLFTPEERSGQTKNTIKSIREKIPGTKIILLESGLKKELPGNIVDLVDEYIYVGDKFFVRLACDSLFKGLGEIITILQLQKNILTDSDYFKISGRYYLNDEFNLHNWEDGEFNFRFMKPKYISTVFYKFKGGSFNILKVSFLISIPFCFLNRSIENLIYRFIPNSKIKPVNRIGVSGLVAVNGELFNG